MYFILRIMGIVFIQLTQPFSLTAIFYRESAIKFFWINFCLRNNKQIYGTIYMSEASRLIPLNLEFHCPPELHIVFNLCCMA